MTRLQHSVLAIVLGAAFMSAVVAVSAQTTPVKVAGAWSRAPLPSKSETSVFMTLDNAGTMAISLIGAATDIANKVEMHEMKMDKDMMMMAPVARIAVPAKGKVELKSGGLHLMVFGLKKKLAEGDTFPLTLTFDDGSSISITVGVRKP